MLLLLLMFSLALRALLGLGDKAYLRFMLVTVVELKASRFMDYSPKGLAWVETNGFYLKVETVL